MQKLVSLKSFMFDTAKYRLVDKEGNEGLLVVNYAENNFKLIAQKFASESRQEVSTFAKDLLTRKHGRNFA